MGSVWALQVFLRCAFQQAYLLATYCNYCEASGAAGATRTPAVPAYSGKGPVCWCAKGGPWQGRGAAPRHQ